MSSGDDHKSGRWLEVAPNGEIPISRDVPRQVVEIARVQELGYLQQRGNKP